MKRLLFFCIPLTFLFSCDHSDNFSSEDRYPKLSNDENSEVPEAAGASDLSKVETKIQRKLIWTADLEFQVKNVNRSTKKLTQLSKKYGGSVSDMQLMNSNSSISNTITIRVPNDQFQDFIHAIKGESVFLNRADISSEDVTEEFVDIESRLKTKREVRARYVEILRTKTGDISDILETEEAIRRITEEIEAKEGRLRYLSNLVDLSTVHVTIYEKMEYVAQPDPFEPSYGEEMGDSLGEGWNALKSLLLSLMAIWPLILVIGSLWFWKRKWIKSIFTSKPKS